MLRKFFLICLAIMVVGSAGCSTVIKQSYYTVAGAQGKFYEISVVNPDVLAGYQSIQVEPFTNSLGERVPHEVITEVNENTPQAVDEEKLFFPEGKPLRITGKIIHYTGESGLKGSVGSVIGGSEECVCRVQLTDGQSGQMIGEAVCWGIVKSALRRGSGELGIGVGKAVAKWLEKRLPEEVVKSRREVLQDATQEEEKASGS